MNSARPASAWLACLCLAAIALTSLGGCKGSPPARRAPDATYTVRGKVVSVPIAGNSRSQFTVHHEAIDNFRSMSGKVTGMNSMTMEFPPAPGVSLEGIKPDDIVELTFSVWWRESDAWQAVKVVKLPPDTVLTFGKAKPTEADATPAAPAKSPVK